MPLFMTPVTPSWVTQVKNDGRLIEDSNEGSVLMWSPGLLELNPTEYLRYVVEKKIGNLNLQWNILEKIRDTIRKVWVPIL